MEFDNPGGGGGWGAGEDQEDFTDSEKSGKEKREKILLGSSKKKDKEKKKEKETRYNQLGADSSCDEDEVKKKKKAFKLGPLAKKDKKEKKDKDSDMKEGKEKKKEKKEKPKLKLKKSQKTDSEPDKTGGAGTENSPSLPPVFGVALDVAVERRRCHDGINLPVVVRECVDYIEAEGLTVEGIYRSSGVKSKITKLKTAYNSRQTVKLASYEPAVVASLLKLFLRELPEPVLTLRLGAKFEEVSQLKIFTDRRDGLIKLLRELPDCNRVLVQWIFVHMGHVIANEKMNKMTLQNVSIVLSPTMRISHRVLNCIFEHHAALFSDVKLTRYIPPISVISNLPDSPQAIEVEMRKQESLLAELHAEISSGVVVGKAREEQLWEQQRIVTQLKRNLRHAKTRQQQQPPEMEYEEELNFALQTPVEVEQNTEVVEAVGVVSSPEDAGDQEHRVTVQIHRDSNSKNVTVIQLNSTASPQTPAVPSLPSVTPSIPSTTIQSSVSVPSVTPPVLSVVSTATTKPVTSHSTSKVISLPSVVPSVASMPRPASVSTPSSTIKSTAVATPASSVTSAGSGVMVTPVITPVITTSKVTTDNVDGTEIQEDSPQQLSSQVVSFSSPILPKKSFVNQQQQSVSQKSKIPLLPPPPPSSKPKTHKRTNSRSGAQTSGGVLLPPADQKLKSKSLPRGLPSDGTVFDQADDTPEKKETADRASESKANDKAEVDSSSKEDCKIVSKEANKEVNKEASKETSKEALLLEELRLKYQYEELLTLKTELERKKRTERREISELEEEIATMQTLYQYRTYSVDSSEEESDTDLTDTKDHRSSLLTVLSQLSKEKKDLEEKKTSLQTKLAAEREACLKLRVNIRLEQERIKRQKLSQVPGIGFGKLNLMD